MSIVQPSSLPRELVILPQWVIWRYEIRDGKPTKVPHTTMGHRASPTNPDHWSTFDYAMKAAARPGFAEGIGFVFHEDDPYCGIDLDNIYPSDAAECASWAEGILERFVDTYSEISPRDKGVKFWCKAKAPRCGKWTVESGAIEIYDRARFFTVTGRSAGILTVADHQHDIELLVENLDQDRGAGSGRVSRTIEEAIPQGQRHPALVSLAGTMFRRGMCFEAIEAALLEVNRLQCGAHYAPEHIHQIIRSMWRWER
jgi:putative DNA primase/helicase